MVLRKEEMGKHEHCSKCGQGFTHEELGKHMKVFHEPLKCTCGVVLEMEEMVSLSFTVPHIWGEKEHALFIGVSLKP